MVSCVLLKLEMSSCLFVKNGFKVHTNLCEVSNQLVLLKLRHKLSLTLFLEIYLPVDFSSNHNLPA